MSPSWPCRSFLTSLSLTRITTDTYDGQDTLKEHGAAPLAGEWGWSNALYHRDQDRLHRSVRGIAMPDGIPLPSGSQSTLLRRLSEPQLLHWDRRVHRKYPASPALWVTSWELLHWLHSTSILGNLQCSARVNLWWNHGEGLQVASTSILADQILIRELK